MFLIFFILLTNCAFNELKRKLYYDSILSIDSLIFIIGTSQMGEDEIKEMIQDIILPMRVVISRILSQNSKVKEDKQNKSMKQEKEIKEIEHIKQVARSNISKNEDVEKKDSGTEILKILKLVGNYALTIDIDSEYAELQHSIEKRNKIFEADISQTAKSLFHDSHLKLIEEFEKFLENENNPTPNDLKDLIGISEPNKQDMLFFDMLETIEKAISESDNLEKIKEREIREFENNLNPKISQKEFEKLKIIFNLGTVFLAPNIFISISKMLFIPEKNIFLENMVNKILKPILTLRVDNSAGTDTEKKENVLIFMNDIVHGKFSKYKEEIDEAYKSRSAILEKFFDGLSENKKDENIEKLDIFLEKKNKKLLQQFEKMRSEYFQNLIILDQELINTYIKFLNTNSEQDKKKIYDFFK